MIYLIQVICVILMYADDTTLYCCLEDIASEDKSDIDINWPLKNVPMTVSLKDLSLAPYYS